MKKSVILLFVYLISQKVIVGQENKALSLEATFIGDAIQNFDGGLKRGSTSLGLINMLITFDTENAKLWKGGTFHVNAHSLWGGHASQDFIGDAQVASNIEGSTDRLIYEAWYKQNFGNFSVLGGIHNLNSEFYVSSNSSLFINSSFGTGAFLSFNNFVSIYPITTLGMIFRYDKETFSFLSGLYNHGNDFVEETRFHLKNHIFRQGYLGITELQFRPTKLIGEYKFGACMRRYIDNKFLENNTYVKEYNYGLYFTGDQHIVKFNNRSLEAFVQLGYYPDKVNREPVFFAGGVNVKGLFSGKENEEFGIGIVTARLNELSSNEDRYTFLGNETTLEVNSRFPVHENISLHPDIQYIINPSGDNSLNNALVGVLRVEMNF